MNHVRIQRGDRGPNMKNHKNKGFLSNTGSDSLKNHKATKPTFNTGPSSAKRHLNGVSLEGRWWPDFSCIWIHTSTKRKNIPKVGLPLKKLSGSALASCLSESTLFSKDIKFEKVTYIMHLLLNNLFWKKTVKWVKWLSGRVLDSRQRGRGFEPHWRHCIVSLRKNINPSLVLVQPRKTRPYITERLLMGHKESNQTKQKRRQLKLIHFSGSTKSTKNSCFHFLPVIVSKYWENVFSQLCTYIW